ncbi:FGGY-family carbohydrate kinase [Deminuibacter soli]|uniref:Carbohydrate kinase n=1 Tax=Deminuibacter soli TaxID=2291815 RepID=A0A3E1NNG7_9BACT|nr:FGGY family carbohydrate kinase [Deminuibacter soli]RFM29476.1 carbohydrate kinase [Deminuibacter soli]
MPIPVVAILDIGKTNKKAFLFNEQYAIVEEFTAQLSETTDEDGQPCEDIGLLAQWVVDAITRLLSMRAYDIRAINFSTYGASMVHLDARGRVMTPLYNYLKPYPAALQQQFYTTYGGEQAITSCTASPALGSLNAGMQLYRIKYRQPQLYERITWSLHLPQYISSLLTNKYYSDITSIGCHTQLWDFNRNTYHNWVLQEQLDKKLPPLLGDEETIACVINGHPVAVGIGMHDSSAALIPYLLSFTDPFVLISTGTWCISLNPFNKQPLTADELNQDCLCYMEYHGRPVKASRLFSGDEHEQQTKKLAVHFGVPVNFYNSIRFNPDIIASLQTLPPVTLPAANDKALKQSVFAWRDLNSFQSYEQAYHCLMADIISLQQQSTRLVIQDTPVRRIFVDGGFSKNPVYMHLLAIAFPHMEVYAAAVAQATAAGAALAIHPHWNTQPLPADLVTMQHYTVTQKMHI